MKLLITLQITLFAAISLRADASMPNVIYLLVDELGYFEPGFMGGETIQTPNIDKAAAGGIVFLNLFAGGSVCAPTRCSLLTWQIRANPGQANCGRRKIGAFSGHIAKRSAGGLPDLLSQGDTVLVHLAARLKSDPGQAEA